MATGVFLIAAFPKFSSSDKLEMASTRNEGLIAVIRSNSKPLSKSHPRLAKEWHRTKNKGVTPKDVSIGSGFKAWWQCAVEKSHVWQTPVSKRQRGDACPYCSGHKVWKGNCLATVNPKAAALWHPKKNGSVTPKDVTANTNKKYWWRCPVDKSHKWQQVVWYVNKTTLKGNSGCPYCHGKKASRTNCIAAIAPELVKEWHKKKNGEITPKDVTRGSDLEIWWKCPVSKEHAYQMKVRYRLKGTGCPYCRKRKIIANENSLAATHPRLAREWHKSKNKDLSPRQVGSGSHLAVWWQCPVAKDHVWQYEIRLRSVNRSPCPFCTNWKASITNSLASKKPMLAREWHTEKNLKSGLTPLNVTIISGKKVWWQCRYNPEHVWKAVIEQRCAGSACPYCVNRRLCDENRLSIQHPKIAAEWHPKKNDKLRASDVISGARRIVWWQCRKSKLHEWRASLDTRTKEHGTGCPYCAGKKVAADNCLKVLYPQVAQNWHKEKNGEVTPAQVRPFSHKKYWWKCLAGHEWQAEIASVVRSWLTSSTNGCLQCDQDDRAMYGSNGLKNRRRAARRVWQRGREAESDDEHRRTKERGRKELL